MSGMGVTTQIYKSIYPFPTFRNRQIRRFPLDRCAKMTPVAKLVARASTARLSREQPGPAGQDGKASRGTSWYKR